MRVTTVKGETWNLKGISDKEYNRARSLTEESLEKCPTCGGHREEIPDSGGVKEFRSRTYKNIEGETVECDCQSQKALRIRYLLANIGDQYQTLDWDKYPDGEVKTAVNDYIENWENCAHHGFGMEFGGESLGVGKTWSATQIGKEMIKRGQSVYFIPFNDLVFSYESDDDSLEERFRSSTFLIIDEVKIPKTARQADLFAERFEAMIRHRTNYNKPTIITTNISEEKLDGAYPRVYSLLAAKQIRVEYKGTDAREKKGKENAYMVMNGMRSPIT